jgi:hypothetical protein
MPYRPIQEGKHHIQYSDKPGEVLQPGGLKPGELAINSADGAVYCGGESQSVVRLSGATSVSTAERVTTVWAKGRVLWDADLGSLWIGTGFLGGEPAGGVMEAVRAGTYASQPLDEHGQALTGPEALSYYLAGQVPVYDGDGVKTAVDTAVGVAYAKLLPASEFGGVLRVRSGTNQTLEVDWGDGSAPQTITSNSDVSHTYTITDKPFLLKITETAITSAGTTSMYVRPVDSDVPGGAVSTWYHYGLKANCSSSGMIGPYDPSLIAWHYMCRRGGRFNLCPAALSAGGGWFQLLNGFISHLPEYGGSEPPADALWHFDKVPPGTKHGYTLSGKNLTEGIPDIFPADPFGVEFGVLFRQSMMPTGTIDLRFLDWVATNLLLEKAIIEHGTVIVPPSVVRITTMGAIGNAPVRAPITGKWNVIFQEGVVDKSNTNFFDFASYSHAQGYDFIPKGSLELESIDAYQMGGYMTSYNQTEFTFSPNVALPLRGVRCGGGGFSVKSSKWARIEDKFSDVDFSSAATTNVLEIIVPEAVTGYSHDLGEDLSMVPIPAKIETRSMPDAPAKATTFDYSQTTYKYGNPVDFRINDAGMAGLEVKWILSASQAGTRASVNQGSLVSRPWLMDSSAAPKYVVEGGAESVMFAGFHPDHADPITNERVLNADWSIFESGVCVADTWQYKQLLPPGSHNVPLDITRIGWWENTILNWSDLLDADSSLTPEMYDKALIWLESKFAAGDYTVSRWTFAPLKFGQSKYTSNGLVARNALVGRGISFTDGGAA